jgi:hypothetical protein
MEATQTGRGSWLTAPVAAERRAFWEKAVATVIGALVVIDLALGGLILISGQAWFDLVHGTDYDDPQGLLKRTGALWLSFALVQAIAFFRWREGPHWLMILAGVRFGDLLSDWTYWLDANDHTWLGHVGLLLASPGNLLLGLFFYRAYFVFRAATSSTAG